MATPLRSIRLSDDVWEALDAYAKEHELKGRPEAIAALLKPQPAPVPLAHTPENLPKPAAPHLAPGRKMLRTEAEREAFQSILDGVPFAGDLKPASRLTTK